MCWLMVQNKDSRALSRQAFTNAWNGNDDGGGFCYAHNGQVIVDKGYYKLKHFMRAYYKAFREYGATSDFIVHFRWATHGADTIDNLHPHAIPGSSCVLAHNGVLHLDTRVLADPRSDTAYFCDTVLAYRDSAFLMSDECKKWLEEMIGDSNKFAIMDEHGNVSIIHEKSGYWNGDYWYSNASHVPKFVSKSIGYSGYKAGHIWTQNPDGTWSQKPPETSGLLATKYSAQQLYGRGHYGGEGYDDGCQGNESHDRWKGKGHSQTIQEALDAGNLTEQEAEMLDAEEEREAILAERKLFSPPGAELDGLTDTEWQERHLEQAFDEAMMAGNDEKCKEIIEEMSKLYGDKQLPEAYRNVL